MDISKYPWYIRSGRFGVENGLEEGVRAVAYDVVQNLVAGSHLICSVSRLSEWNVFGRA